jgi:thioredoxin 1
VQSSGSPTRRNFFRPGIAVIAATILLGAVVLTVRQSSSLMSEAPTDLVVAALSKGKPTVIEFGASRCAACREMKSVLADLAREHGDRIEVVEVDLLKRREYLAGYRIQLMPTQVFFDAHGREIGRNLGTITARQILAQLDATSADRTP